MNNAISRLGVVSVTLGLLFGAAHMEIAVASAPQVTDRSAVGELAYWNQVKESSNADDLKAYLDNFPNGMFVDPAVARYEQLTGKKPEGISASLEVPDESQTLAPPPVVETKKPVKAPLVSKTVKLKTKKKYSQKTTSQSSKKSKTASKTKKSKTASKTQCKATTKDGKCLIKVASKPRTPIMSESSGGGGGGNSGGGGGWH